jgi:predicted RNase H-like nuclease (RuvC/YqgF family)
MSNLSSQLEELTAPKAVFRRLIRTVVKGWPPRRSKRKRLDKRTRQLQKQLVTAQNDAAQLRRHFEEAQRISSRGWLLLETHEEVHRLGVGLQPEMSVTLCGNARLVVEQLKLLCNTTLPETFVGYRHKSVQTDEADVDYSTKAEDTDQKASVPLTDPQKGVSDHQALADLQDTVALKNREIEDLGLDNAALQKEKHRLEQELDTLKSSYEECQEKLALMGEQEREHKPPSNEGLTSEDVRRLFIENLRECQRTHMNPILKDVVLEGF